MYERFTDRARKVMQLANQEAQRFNHEYTGTEHLLLGLVREGSLTQQSPGVAAKVLKNFDIDLCKIRLEVEKIVQSGPDMVNMRKLPQTPRAKKVIEYAIEEARRLNLSDVGTGLLLLGLLREQECVAAQVLMNLGLGLEEVRRALQGLPVRRIGPPPEEALPDLPAEVFQTVRQIEDRIAQINQEKELAVAACDFERAARLRDKGDKLKKQRANLIREGQTESRHGPHRGIS